MATHPNIDEAVALLSDLADFDIEKGKQEFLEGTELSEGKLLPLDQQKHWWHQKDPGAAVGSLKEIFRVVLTHLKQVHKKHSLYSQDPIELESIKSIMVLVGEAAKKLDRYTHLFHRSHESSITSSKEYKELQEFYLSKIAHHITESTLGKWILGISLGFFKGQEESVIENKQIEEESAIKHVYVDLDIVKQDTEYELFFIRKMDGSRFYSPRLLKNIKLVCDFGETLQTMEPSPLLENMREWRDRVSRTNARSILKGAFNLIEEFYHDQHLNGDLEIETGVHDMILALMLSSHTHHLLQYSPIKNCASYFEDFQYFLRKTLQDRSYQKWLAYSPQSPKEKHMFDLINRLCQLFFTRLVGQSELYSLVQGMIQEGSSLISREHQVASENENKLWNYLAKDARGLNKMMKQSSNGPMSRVLEILDENFAQSFDPILQQNIPNQLFDLYHGEERVAVVRIPTPVTQEYIQSAIVNDEFKAHLRKELETQGKQLLINLQDRTSWREHARCEALEGLEKLPEFSNLVVVTFATDTDFYHQSGHYADLTNAKQFIEQFIEQFKDEQSGFYLSSKVDQKELQHFIQGAMKTIHRIFFFEKNVLNKEQRLDFIQIFYGFLVLKLIEMEHPSTLSLTCKDGIDVGQAFSAGLFGIMKLVDQKPWTDGDREYLNYILHSAAILIRERAMLEQPFNRFLSGLKRMEVARDEFGVNNFNKAIREGFSFLFKTPILDSVILFPKH